MNTIRTTITQKIRSDRGASLMMALLLFLVCAILGAVVLTAATASAGRVAEMAEMDRRYYSVTSAAELLADRFSGETVVIERTRTWEQRSVTPFTVSGQVGSETVTAGATAVTKSVTYGTAINRVTGPQPTSVSRETDDGTEPAVTAGTPLVVDVPGRSFLTSRAVALLFGADSGSVLCNSDAAFSASMRDGHTETGTFSLTHVSGDVDADELTITGEYETEASGTLVIRLTGDGYTLTVRMKPDISETEYTVASGDGVPTVVHTDAKHYTETVVLSETVTKTSSVTWTVESIR